MLKKWQFHVKNRQNGQIQTIDFEGVSAVERQTLLHKVGIIMPVARYDIVINDFWKPFY